ncbi:MAG: energy transducer TonB [Nitrospirota bacterium]|nr:energy transducer TonB [Nitrospirota bacterium]
MSRSANNIKMPSPYIVNLVTQGDRSHKTGLRGTGAAAGQSRSRVAKKNAAAKKRVKAAAPRGNHLSTLGTTRAVERKRVEDRIAELAAKKRVERIVKLRSIISLKGKSVPGDRASATQGGGGPASSKGTPFADYYTKITTEIWQEWVYPDLGEENLETVIFVRILKNGSINVQGIEKSSGNQLFDRSALRAITKASPVTPPPYEMEVGIRFYP